MTQKLFKYSFKKRVNVRRLINEIKNSSITVRFDHVVQVDENTVVISFRDSLSTSQEATLGRIIDSHIGEAPAQDPGLPYNDDKDALRVVAKKPDDANGTIVTHNWCDKTTWYQGSIRVEDKVLTRQSDTIYNTGDTNIIDVINGKIFGQEELLSYQPVVRIDGEIAGDYSVNYETGVITFGSSVSTSAEVTATYHKADTSFFKVKPSNARKLRISQAKLQFYTDCDINVPVVFAVMVPHPTYGMVPYKSIVYNSAADIIASCNKKEIFPKFGSMPSDVHAYIFDYIGDQIMKASTGAELWVYTEGHEALTGTYATTSFYYTSEIE